MKKFWLPYSLWDIQGIELWLNELAAKGYELKKFSKFWYGRAEFQPSEEAKHCRYRLDPIGKDERELRERAANYRELGWSFDTKIGSLYAVYRCDDPDAPDLYTDPQSLGWAMKRLMGRQWLALAVLLLWLALVFRDEWKQLFTAPAIIPMNLVLYDLLIPLYILMVATVAGIVIGHIRRLRFFRRMKKRLADGEWPRAGRRRYPERWRFLGSAAFFAAVLVLVVSIPAFGLLASDTLSGPKDWNFPHITLDEAVPAGADCSISDAQKPIRRDTFSQSLLAPEQYRVGQGGTAVLPGGTRQAAFFTLEYVRTRSPALAGVVLQGKAEERRQALEEYRANWEENTPYIHDHTAAFDFVREDTPEVPGLDEAVRFTFQFSDEDNPRTFYAGRLGNQVVTLYCSGAVDPEGALALMTQRLAEAQ